VAFTYKAYSKIDAWVESRFCWCEIRSVCVCMCVRVCVPFLIILVCVTL